MYRGPLYFKNRDGSQVVRYEFDGEVIRTSLDEIITESANQHRKRTAKGENLKVVGLTWNNWVSAARIHADKAGFFRPASEWDFNKPADNSGLTMREIVRDWAAKDRF